MKVVVAAAIVVPLLAAGLASGCGGDDDAADPPTLENVPWVLTSGVDVEGWEAVAPGIRFGPSRFGGSTGCNRYGGSYTVDGDMLDLGEIAATLIACPPPADAVERAYLAALERVARWSVDDDELTLLDADEAEVLLFVAATPSGEWEVTAFARDTGVTSPIVGTELTASFEGGRLTGSAGCNTYTTSYTLDGEAIAIEPAAATRKLCPGPPGVMEQETAYLAALTEAARFGVVGGSLELQREDGTIVATFARPT